MKKYLPALLLILSLSPALAREPEMFEPKVEQGSIEAQYEGFFAVDDRDDEGGAWVQEAAIAYGVTQNWQSEVEADFAKSGASGADPRLSALEWHNILLLTEQDDSVFDTALFGQYSYDFEMDDHVLEARLLLAKNFADFENLANLVVTQQVNQGETTGAAEFRSRYAMSDAIKPGFELYADIGANPQHQAGPMLYGKAGDIEVQAGYLFGLNDDAPDGTIKAVLSYKF